MMKDRSYVLSNVIVYSENPRLSDTSPHYDRVGHITEYPLRSKITGENWRERQAHYRCCLITILYLLLLSLDVKAQRSALEQVPERDIVETSYWRYK
jgi:hypothetical protein